MWQIIGIFAKFVIILVGAFPDGLRLRLCKMWSSYPRNLPLLPLSTLTLTCSPISTYILYNINIKVFFTRNTRIRPFTAVFGPPPSRPAPEISYTRYGRHRYPPVHEPLLDGRARTRDGWQPYFWLILVWHLLPESHAVKRRGGFAYWTLLYSLRFPELSTNFHEGWSTSDCFFAR